MRVIGLALASCGGEIAIEQPCWCVGDSVDEVLRYPIRYAGADGSMRATVELRRDADRGTLVVEEDGLSDDSVAGHRATYTLAGDANGVLRVTDCHLTQWCMAGRWSFGACD